MGTKREIFLSEKRILEEFDRSRSRLGIGREFYRLTNVMNDILDESSIDFENKNRIYTRIESKIKREYKETKKRDLDYKEMKIWHKSMFSCLDLFRRELTLQKIERDEVIPKIFERILNKNLESRISQFCIEEGIEDFTEDLFYSRPKEKLVDELKMNTTGENIMLEGRSWKSKNQIVSSGDVSNSNNTQKQLLSVEA